MNTQATSRTSASHIDRELDQALASGPLRDIVIPPCPELLVALRTEMGKADPDPLAIADIAGRDVAMAASLIRTANSPFYARSRPVTSVPEALGLLGVRASEKLLTTFLVRHAIRINSPLIEHFWETSTRRAMAMGYIAQQLYGVDVDVAHTCGLFCHVGIPVMLQGVKGYSGTLAEALARQDRTFTETETENAAHRTDHAVVGAIVARTWRLPPIISVAVRLHHDFTVLKADSVPQEARTLVAMALVAEYLVGQHEGVREQKEWARHGDECLGFLNINKDELDSWVDNLHPLFDSVTAG